MSEAALAPETHEAALRAEKLRLEIEGLKESQRLNSRIGRLLPMVSALVPILALLFAVQQFGIQQEATAEALNRQTLADERSSERAFMQPVLTRQLDSYLAASSAVATVASSNDPSELAKARADFWRLYLGPLVMFESPEVSGAMKRVGACLDLLTGCPKDKLHDLSLALSSSLQADYFAAWPLSPKDCAKRSIEYAAILRGSER